MGEVLELSTLGGLQIRRGGATLTGFESRKARALLIYLAVERRPHTRSALAGLLWGDYPESRAGGNLRRVLTNLRHLVPDHLLITRQTVEFDRESDYRLDVEGFERKVNAGAAGEILREGVDLYRGDFLEGFYVRGAPAFEEWMLAERERLRMLALFALQRLVQCHTRRGEYTAGIEYATRLLAMDPWREEAHRQVMRMLALAGQRSAALAQYEKCRRLLKVELGLEPLEETKALYERIRDSYVRGPTLREHEYANFPFVGRGDEHAQLVAWWEKARRGGRQLALVEGEAGVGKTRLVEEVVRYAETQGATVLRGHCYEFGSDVPYQPIAEVLRGYFHDAGTRRQGDGGARGEATQPPVSLPPVWLAELGRLLPELRERVTDLSPPVEADGKASRQRLFEAVTRFLLAICDLQPAILFLDDLHWADPSTLDLLHYLVRQLEDAPLWIVGTYRPEEVSLSHPLTRLRQGLGRDHLVDRLILEPLSAGAVEEIALALVGEEDGASLGDFLYRESEGNPFVLVETVNSLQEQGVLRGGEGAWQWAGPPGAGTLPAGVQDVILQRVGRLSETAQRLLMLAAVIGRQFDLALLRTAAGQDADVVSDCLREWLNRHLIRPMPPSHFADLQARPLLDFSHDKIRAVVYHAAGGQRPMLHRRIGEALEKLHADRLEDVYEQLAYHYEQAGDVGRALTYLPLAAAKATAVYAHQEALRYYDRALAMLEGQDERRWQILLSRGRVLRFLNRYDEAIADWLHVIEAGKAGSGGRPLAAQAASELSTIYLFRRDYDQARTWLREAERLTGPSHAREWAQARRLLGQIEREQGNLEGAQRLFEEALAMYRTLGDRRGVAESLDGLGRIFFDLGRHEVALQRLQEALDLFRALGDRQREADCLRAIGRIHWDQERGDAARRSFAESLDICRVIGDRRGEARCLADLGLVYLAEENYDETRRCWRESVSLYRTLGLEKRTASVSRWLGILCEVQGEFSAARRHLEESLTIDRATGARMEEMLDMGWLGKVLLSCGEYEEARRNLEAALAMAREIGGGEETVFYLIWLGGVAYETGNLAGAGSYLEEAIGLSREQGIGLGAYELSWLVPVYLARRDGEAALVTAREGLAEAEAGAKRLETGVCSALLGTVHGSGLLADPEDPRPFFERALALLGDWPFARGVALRRYGACLLHGGHRGQGQAHLREAQGVFERIGAKGELGKVNRLLSGDEAPWLRW